MPGERFARDGALDRDLMASVLAVAPGLPVTLHRAFDSVRDPEAAIDAALGFPQIDSILTSGGSGDWRARCERLTAWSKRAGPETRSASPGRGRITILPGGGVDEQALRVLAACPAIVEAHVGKAAR